MHTKTTASLDRRLFLARLAAASGGAAVGLAGLCVVTAAERFEKKEIVRSFRFRR